VILDRMGTLDFDQQTEETPYRRASRSAGGVIAVWKRRRPPSTLYTPMVLSLVSPWRSILKFPT
jgi:hypothetical protein